jgi:5'-nucleotidase
VAKHAGRPDFAITYGEAFDVQPFGNTLVTLKLSGAEIRALLEAQFGERAEPRILQVSRNLSYSYSYDRATRRGTITSLEVRKKPIDPKAIYRVTVNSYLAGGGDGFALLKAAHDRTPGGPDVDALTTYLAKTSSAKAPLVPRALDRIRGDGCK